jgi:hypothetical protein
LGPESAGSGQWGGFGVVVELAPDLIGFGETNCFTYNAGRPEDSVELGGGSHRLAIEETLVFKPDGGFFVRSEDFIIVFVVCVLY